MSTDRPTSLPAALDAINEMSQAYEVAIVAQHAVQWAARLTSLVADVAPGLPVDAIRVLVARIEALYDDLDTDNPFS